MARLTAVLAGFAFLCFLDSVHLATGAEQPLQVYLGKTAVDWQQELSQAKDAKAKRNAAFALGKLGSRSLAAVPELMQILANANEDAGVRETAAYSLGEIVPRGSSKEEVYRLLCQLAVPKTDNDRLAHSAVVALGKCGDDTAEIRAALGKAMESPSPAVRQNAAWALGEICKNADDPPVSLLRKGIKSGEQDKLVKRDAAVALGKLASGEPTGSLDAQQRERQRIGKAREQVRAAVPDLLRCVGEDYVELKKAAAGALINLVDSKDTQALPILAKACGKSEDIEVRFNAAQAMANIGGTGAEPAVPVLQEVLRNKKADSEWRQNAALAFRTLGAVAAPALPELLEALENDADLKVRYNAAVALGGWKTDPSQVVPALVKVVVNSLDNADVRAASASSLQTIGKCPQADTAVPALVGVLDNPAVPARVRWRVVWALKVHQNDLANSRFDNFFAALKKVLTEKELRDGDSSAKMLRYDAAYLLAIFKRDQVPDEVFPALLDFLKDNTIRIFAGLTTGGGRVGEGRTGTSVVAEQVAEDGRTLVVQALDAIGPQRVRTKAPEIVEQLRFLRDDDATDPTLREAVTKMLKGMGGK
jgi:HEAT repeat protein